MAALALTACKTDLEINAPYRDVTVVYGLLDQGQDTQFVKINKAFQGEGDALVYAQIPDSSEYGNEDIQYARVHRIQNGQRVKTMQLVLDTANRVPGTFYSPEHQIFYFTDTAVTFNPGENQYQLYLMQDTEYELDVMVKNKHVTARTNVVNDFGWHAIMVAPQIEMTYYSGAQGYVAQIVRWNSARDGRRYEVSWRFNYIEVRSNGDEIPRSFTQRIGTRVADNSQSIMAMEIPMEGASFYSAIAANVPADPQVVQRKFAGLDFIITVANDEFHTVLSLSEPVSGIIEERPAYSNVENGYGIFASRYTKELRGKYINGASLQELMNGPITGHLNFCSLLHANCD